MADQYKTISKNSTGIYKEKGSKFLSFATPVNNEEEIKSILINLRKEYHDARHYCYAWCLGEERSRYRVNDDGEPSNSAGKPILTQINSNDLTNILIVVVRYFGGTLLGIGGLINAYREAAADAIHNNSIIKKRVYEEYKLSFDYPLMNSIMTIIKEHNLEQFDQDFGLNCSLKIKVWRKESELITGLFDILDGCVIESLS